MPRFLATTELSNAGLPRRALHLWRVILRQWLVFLCAAAVAWGSGALYMAWRGVSLETASIWGVFGLAVATLIAIINEIRLGVVYNIAGAERVSGRAVGSAAPMISMRTLAPDRRNPFGCAVFQPASKYAVAIRHFLSVLGDARVVALLGGRPTEGATATASSLAALASQQGRSVLLIDCDLRHRAATRLLDHEPEAGVLEAVANPERWEDLIEQEMETGLHILPAAKPDTPWAAIFGAPGFTELLKKLRDRYDLIVLDCPPALTDADGALIARTADLCAVVVSCDETPGADLRQIMRRLRPNPPGEISVHMNRAPRGIVEMIAAEAAAH